jgi:alpha-galactosidase
MSTPIQVTVIGAGSIVFSLALVKDICLTPGLSGSKVYFMDINPETLDVVYNLAVRYAQDFGADLKFEKTLSRAEALRDADFVVNTATITHNEYYMRRTREIAAEHGYYYDHIGMPEYHNLQLMLDIARDMEKLCPDAWIVQAGNPVSTGTTLITRQTGIKMVGLCHGHYGYREIAHTLGVDQPDQVTWQAPGLNHNVWLTHFYYEGQNLYPVLDAWIEKDAAAYWEAMQKTEHGIPAQMSPAAVHQYHMFGLMPVGDTPRVGGWWYHAGPEARMRWYGGPIGGGDTPEGRERIIRGKEEKYADMMKAAFDPQVRPVDLFGKTHTSEQHVPIIDALVNDHEGQFQVNVPNKGALAGLPDDVAVEVPAVVSIKGIQPLRVQPLPRKVLLECIYPEWLEMERTIEALLAGDKSMLLWGVLDGHTTRSYDQAVEVLEALLHQEGTEATKTVQDINEHYRYPAGL